MSILRDILALIGAIWLACIVLLFVGIVAFVRSERRQRKAS